MELSACFCFLLLFSIILLSTGIGKKIDFSKKIELNGVELSGIHCMLMMELKKNTSRDDNDDWKENKRKMRDSEDTLVY